MKRESPLRREMIIRFVLAALVPVVIFAVATQINMRRNNEQYMEAQIQSTLETANYGLDMVLDKYSTILYDLCTDDEILDIVQKINDEEDTLDVNSSTLRHELSHICNRNTGVEGIVISLACGETFFYDRLSSSSTHSVWAKDISVPEVEKGEVYLGGTKPVVVNGENAYMFRIARNLVDYRNIHEVLGTVVLCVNEKQLQEALDVGPETPMYLLDGRIVISSPNDMLIGRNYETFIDTKNNIYTRITNATCGLTILSEQQRDIYTSLMHGQRLLLMVVAILSVIAAVLLTYSYTRSYLNVVDEYVEVMNRVQEGDLSARAGTDARIPLEMQRIGHGFNVMVQHISELIDQVKQASMEQRNAELSALEAQIDPHFLYNILDVINWKAIENEQYDISEMLGALADILRYSVKNAGSTATLKAEMEWLEQYLLLQSAKLGKTPELLIEIPEELMEVKIHKLLLQPFVENTMKYAFTEKEDQCVIEIRAKMMEGQLHISIEDSGKGIEPEMLTKLNNENADMGAHMGIANVRKRLKLYYGEEAEVYFESIPDNYTRVHLFIPVKEEDYADCCGRGRSTDQGGYGEDPQ